MPTRSHANPPPKLNSFPRERTTHFNTNESFDVFFFQLSKYPFSGWPRLVTLLGTNISPWKVHFESMIFRTFFSGGICIHFLEGNHHLSLLSPLIRPYFQGIFMLNFRGWFFQTLHESSRCSNLQVGDSLRYRWGCPRGGNFPRKRGEGFSATGGSMARVENLYHWMIKGEYGGVPIIHSKNNSQ